MLNKKVKINIKNKKYYTEDLYKSIQKEKGIIIKEKSNNVLVKENEYLVLFSKKVLNKFRKTHSGKWGGPWKIMQWWIPKTDFKLLKA